MRNYLLPFLIIGLTFSCFSQDKLKALDKDLTTISYPFKVNTKTVTSQEQELKMAYLDVSPKKTNGKTVVLLHGKNFNAAYWEKTIKELNKKGFRVIAPDQIGFGKSDKPEHYQYSFSQLAANTKSILDSLNIRTVTVLGHSMGGMLATRFALQYPEMTEKLILENPIGLEDYKTMIKYKTVDENYQTELKSTPESIKSYQLKNYYDNKWKSEYDRWVNMLAGWTLHKDYPIIARNAALTTDMVVTQPVLYEFGNIACPTLLIIGTRDRTAIGKDTAPNEVQYKMGLYNQLGKKTQQAIPNAKLIELDNVGHLPHIEAFDRFIKPLLQFLGE